MSYMSREHLIDDFVKEIQVNIPSIRNDLASFSENKRDWQNIEQVYRLFHNIKGSSAQLSLKYISGVAHIAEDLLEELLINGKDIRTKAISFIDRVAKDIQEISRGDTIRSEEIGQKLLADTINGFRELTGDPPENRQTIQSTIEMLLNGESIIKKPEVNTPEEYLNNSFTILETLKQNASENDNSVQTAFLLNELSSQIHKYVITIEHDQPSQLNSFSESLIEFLFWLAGEPASRTAQVSGLIEKYLHFIKILANSQVLVDPVKIDSITETMQQVKELTLTTDTDSDVFEADENEAAADSQDFLFAEDHLLDPVEDILIEDPFAETEDEETESTKLDVQNTTAAQFDVQALMEEPDFIQEDPEPAVDDENAELQEIFLSECEEHLHIIGKALSSLEQQVLEPSLLSGSVETNLSDMRRAIHTLKGAAGMVGFAELSSLAHRCEDLLDTIYEAADMVYPAEVSILADSIDMIEIMARTPQKTDPERLTRIADTLQAALASRTESDQEGGSLKTVSQAETEVSLEEALTEEAVEKTDPANENTQALFDTGSIRVQLENLDEIVNLESELIVARITMEQGVDELSQTTRELNLAKDKLRKLSQELETGFEVESLYGFGRQDTNTQVNDSITAQKSEFDDFDAIELDRYSQLSLIIRSLNELTVDVGSIHSEISEVTNELKGHIARQQLMMSVMQDKLMRVRMTPMSSISRNFFRTVRGVAEELNKKVHLLVKGEDVYLDRFIWSKISDPIMHILRNSVDHGLESPVDRITAGKPEQASITIEAKQQGRQVVLQIADDGKGIDLNAIRERLIEKHIVESVDAISDEDLLEYLFIPGFTTKQDVSQISGRGVGLDVVRQHVQELRGSVRIKTSEGEGTTFEIRIPMTLALNRAIIITLDEEKYAVPFHDIIEVRKVSPEDVVHDREFFLKVGERIMPLRDLAAMLGIRDESIKKSLREGDLTVIVVPGEKDQVALIVDTIVEQQEIIVKSLGSHLRHVIGISGATIMGDASLVPILNTGELVAAERQAVVTKRVTTKPALRHAPIKVLIVDDSVSVRQSVSRLIKSNGWEAGLATDGMDATEKIDDFNPDIIILDIEMPRMNGFEFMGFLRGNKNHQHVPVIMLTSRISEKHKKKALELGANHYMSKPYQEEEFISTIKSSVGRL